MTETAGADETRRLDQLADLIGGLVLRAAGSRAGVERDEVVRTARSGLVRRLADETSAAHRVSHLHRHAVSEAVEALQRHQVWRNGHEVEVDTRTLSALEAAISELPPELERAVRGSLVGLEVSELQAVYGWPARQAWAGVAKGWSEVMARLRASGFATNERSLRDQYGRGADPGHHLDGATWSHLAAGELWDTEKRNAFDHVGRCRACATVYRALVDFEHKVRAVDPSYPEALTAKGSEHLGLSWQWLAAAAAVVAVLAVAAFTFTTLRRAATTGPMMDLAKSRVVALEPLGPLSAQPQSFVWQALPEATGYLVRLYSEDGVLIWESSRIAETSVAWPVSLDLGTGRYFWRVEAYRENLWIANSPPITVLVPPLAAL